MSLLLALMCKYSCEESELVVYNGRAYRTVEVEKGTILDNMERVLNTDFTQVPPKHGQATWDELKVCTCVLLQRPPSRKINIHTKVHQTPRTSPRSPHKHGQATWDELKVRACMLLQRPPSRKIKITH